MIPIDELREALLSERRLVLERVTRAEDDLCWFDSNVEPEAQEEGQEASLARLLARLDDRGHAEIEAIDRALARIGLGEYGRCEECGSAIPVERLRALPATANCAPCAIRLERRCA
jgi:RNA polymerase-binding transcription factor DksA